MINMFTKAYVLVQYAAEEKQKKVVACIPTNGAFDALNPLFETIEGAIGSLMFKLVKVLFVAALVYTVVLALNDKAARGMRIMATILAVPLAGIVLIIVFTALVQAANKLCSSL